MSKEDIKELGGCWEGREVELESLTEENINGEFKIVDKKKVSVDSLSDKISQLLYVGNSKVIQITLESTKETDEKYTVIVDREDMKAVLKEPKSK